MLEPKTWIKLRKVFALANLVLAAFAVIAGVRLHLLSSAPGDLVITVLFGPGLALLGLVAAVLWAFVLKGRRWARRAAVLFTLGLIAGDGATIWLLRDAARGGSLLPLWALGMFVAAALCLQLAALRGFPEDDGPKG